MRVIDPWLVAHAAFHVACNTGIHLFRIFMKNLFSSWRSDVPSSVSFVFLVAMPLCLGIALASGAPLIAGLIAGIIGGIVVGLYSGSALGVSGPATGLAAIVLTSIGRLGSFPLFLTSVALAGAIQLTLGIMRASIMTYLPEQCDQRHAGGHRSD